MSSLVYVRRKETAPVPSWDEVFQVCVEQFSPEIKEILSKGTIDEIESHSDGSVLGRELNFVWRDFLEEKYFLEENRHLFVNPPEMRNLGSFIQLLRTRWYWNPTFLEREIDNPEFAISGSGVDLSPFDRWEKQIITDLLGVNAFNNFEELVLAFLPIPALKVMYLLWYMAGY